MHPENHIRCTDWVTTALCCSLRGSIALWTKGMILLSCFIYPSRAGHGPGCTCRWCRNRTPGAGWPGCGGCRSKCMRCKSRWTTLQGNEGLGSPLWSLPGLGGLAGRSPVPEA
jgi:hypothetical protein